MFKFIKDLFNKPAYVVLGADPPPKFPFECNYCYKIFTEPKQPFCEFCGTKLKKRVRAQTKEKKEEILKRILVVWQSPEFEKLRLSQMIEAFIGKDIFYYEDEVFAKTLEDALERRRSTGI